MMKIIRVAIVVPDGLLQSPSGKLARAYKRVLDCQESRELGFLVSVERGAFEAETQLTQLEGDKRIVFLSADGQGQHAAVIAKRNADWRVAVFSDVLAQGVAPLIEPPKKWPRGEALIFAKNAQTSTRLVAILC